MDPEALIEAIGEEHRADFRDFGISFDNYHTTHSPENRACSELIYARLKEAGPRRAQGRRAGVRPGEGDVPAGPLRQGHLPELRRPGSVRGQLRGLRRDLQPGGPRRRGVGAVGGEARAAHLGALLRASGEFRGAVAAVARRRRSGRGAPRCRPRSPTSSTSGSTPASRTGTSRATPRTSGSRSPTSPASTSTSGWTRRSGTWGATGTCARAAATSTSRAPGARAPRWSSTTSWARTLRTSTPCSGPPCCTARVSGCPRGCSSTASSPSTARRCRSGPAPS